MENTIENKAKFFSLYWGQNISHWGDNLETYVVNCRIFKELDETDYLELKPLSSISDEDAVLGAKILNELNYTYFISFCNKIQYGLYIGQNRYLSNKLINAIDFLRSKGYALDWNGITVEQQIEYGWVKLK